MTGRILITGGAGFIGSWLARQLQERGHEVIRSDLFNSDEVLGLTLATMHNIAFYQQFVKTAREKITDGDFHEWKTEFIKTYETKS